MVAAPPANVPPLTGTTDRGGVVIPLIACRERKSDDAIEDKDANPPCEGTSNGAVAASSVYPPWYARINDLSGILPRELCGDRSDDEAEERGKIASGRGALYCSISASPI